MRKAFVISKETARKAAAKGRKEALQYCVRKYRMLAKSTQAHNMEDAEIYTDTCALCFRYQNSGVKCPLIGNVCGWPPLCHEQWRFIYRLARKGYLTSFRRACRDFANIINRKLAPKDRI